MFDKLKITITELAYSAVTIAEENLQSASGKEKKQAAIDYITSLLPVADVFKGFISFFLSNFIEEAIEHALKYVKEVRTQEV